MGTNEQEPTSHGFHWLQDSLFGEEVVEAVVRVGRVSDGGTWQFQVEVFSQPGKKLVGMRSWPGVERRQLGLVSNAVLEELLTALESMSMPF